MTKGNLAVLSGWRVLRYSADDLSKRPDEVVEEVKGVLGID
jgi:very-short-patch-repair endonuclease